MRKNDRMLAVEKEHGGTLEEILPKLILEHGQAGTARLLNIPRSTVNYWLLKAGLQVERVVSTIGAPASDAE